MPRITGDSLAEHREAVLAALMDGTERILLSDDQQRLTAASVAAEAGIARNSIYRYVSSIDDLVDMVVARGFAEWAEMVRSEVAAAGDPRSAVIAYVHSNLRLTASGEHRIQRSLTRAGLSDASRERIRDFHQQIAAILVDAVDALDARHPDLLVTTVQALVDGGLGLVGPDHDSDRAIRFIVRSTEAVLDAD